MRTKLSTSMLALFIATPALMTPALAQQPFQLGTITLFSNQNAKAVARSGATVEVITDSDVKRARATSFSDLLAEQPGVSLSRNGGVQAATTLRIRGLNTNYIGVRIDGIDVTDPTGPQNAFNFGGLLTGGFGRAEVLKGTQSAIYGSDAIAGVVNLKTFVPDTPGLSGRASAEVGTYNTFNLGLGFANVTDRGHVALSLSRYETDGFSARATDTEDDGFEKTEARLVLEQDLTDQLRFGLSALWSTEEGGFDNSSVDPSGIFTQDRRGARAFLRWTGDVVTHEFALSRFDTERTSVPGFSRVFTGERSTAEYKGIVTINAATKLTFGGDATRETAQIDATGYGADEWGLFAELDYAASDALDLTVSARHDNSGDFGGFTSVRGSLAWSIREDLILRANAGTGLRAPSLFERFSAFGNLALVPEESRGIDLGIEKRLGGDDFVKATLFYNEIDNRIGFGAATYVQVAGATVSQGLELSGRKALTDRLSVWGNYTLTDADTNGTSLLRVPRHELVLGVDFAVNDRLSGQMSLQYISDRGDLDFSTFPGTPVIMGATTLVNLGVGYALSDTADAFLRVENLTDQRYQTAFGFNSAGRTVMFGVQASF